jgi:hypothetical protein
MLNGARRFALRLVRSKTMPVHAGCMESPAHKKVTSILMYIYTKWLDKKYAAKATADVCK